MWLVPSGFFEVEVLSPGFLGVVVLSGFFGVSFTGFFGVPFTGFLGVSGVGEVLTVGVSNEKAGGRGIEPVSELDETLDFEVFFVLTFFTAFLEMPSLFLLFPATSCYHLIPRRGC